MSWMKFMLDGESVEKMLMLDAIHSNAVSVWLRAYIFVKNNSGTLTLKSLFASLVNKKMSRRCVIEILTECGDFVVDEEQGIVSLSETGYGRMNVCSGKNAQAKPLAGANLPEQNDPNAPTRIEEKDKEEETDCVHTHEEWPSEPEQMKRYKGELWYPYVQRLFLKENTQLWRETLMQQIYDKELVGLIDRHWDETLLMFAEHLVAWPSPHGCLSETDVRLRFRRFIIEDKLPMRILKHHLQRMELRQKATDPRELRFYDFMDQHCPHLVQMEQAMTYPQFDALRQQYGKERVLNVLCDMENDPKLHKRDCCATAQRWLERPPRSPTGGRTGS